MLITLWRRCGHGFIVCLLALAVACPATSAPDSCLAPPGLSDQDRLDIAVELFRKVALRALSPKESSTMTRYQVRGLLQRELYALSQGDNVIRDVDVESLAVEGSGQVWLTYFSVDSGERHGSYCIVFSRHDPRGPTAVVEKSSWGVNAKMLLSMSPFSDDKLDDSMIETLMEGSGVDSGSNARRTAETLENSGDSQAQEVLMLTFKHADDFARIAVVESVARAPQMHARTVLQKALSDPSPDIRSAVAGAWWLIPGANEKAIDFLKPLFKDKYVEVRLKAAESLAKLHHPAGIRHLLEIRSAPEASEEQRRAAVMILESFRPKPEHQREFLELLRDSDKEMRLRGIGYAGTLDNPTALDYLTQILAIDSDETVREAAILILSEKPYSLRVYEAMTNNAGSPNPRIRLTAINALARFETLSATPYLVHALKDVVASVRIAAIKGLGKLKPRDAEAPLERTALRDVDANVQWEAARALEELKGRSDLIKFLVLAAVESARLPRERIAALSLITRLGAVSSAAKELTDIASINSDAEVRMQALKILSASEGFKGAQDRLSRRIDAPDPEIQQLAVEALGWLAQEMPQHEWRGDEKLLTLLKSQHEHLYEWAKDALEKAFQGSNLGENKKLGGVLRTMLKSGDKHQQLAAAELLQYFVKDNDTVPALLDAMDTTHWQEAIDKIKVSLEILAGNYLIMAIEHTYEPTADPEKSPLIRLAKAKSLSTSMKKKMGQDENPRADAINAIALWRQVSAAPVLVALLEDPDVGRVAEEAIKAIGPGTTKALNEGKYRFAVFGKRKKTNETIDLLIQWVRIMPKVPQMDMDETAADASL